MKTAEEIYNTITANGMREMTRERAIQMSEEYADQWKYDFSKACKCKDSPGSTWCCNLCGLPIKKAINML